MRWKVSPISEILACQSSSLKGAGSASAAPSSAHTSIMLIQVSWTLQMVST